MDLRVRREAYELNVLGGEFGYPKATAMALFNILVFKEISFYVVGLETKMHDLII